MPEPSPDVNPLRWGVAALLLGGITYVGLALTGVLSLPVIVATMVVEGSALLLVAGASFDRRHRHRLGVRRGVRPTERVELAAPAGLAFEAVADVLASMPAAERQTIDAHRLRAEVRLPSTGRSWGEVVWCTVETGAAPGESRVVVRSRHVMKTAIFDGGKNAENVRTVVSGLHERFNSTPRADPRT